MKIRQRLLSYALRLDSRPVDSIDLVVIHCTELPDLAMAQVWGEKVLHPETQTGNSGHFYIDRDGSIEQWVPLDRVAHHARGFNPHSIGIELVNTGRYPDWFHSAKQLMTEPYPFEQTEALATLLNHLVKLLPGLENISGHSDLDTGMQPSEDRPELEIRRKTDPGPLFPWSAIMDTISLNRFTANNL